MEQTRVNKGEKYWFVTTEHGEIDTDCIPDNRTWFDDELFKCGNYFRSQWDAEAVAEKFRRVLKGADIIEMPSEEEAKIKSERQLELSVACDDKWTEEAYLDGFADCLHWLKSKIVK